MVLMSDNRLIRRCSPVEPHGFINGNGGCGRSWAGWRRSRISRTVPIGKVAGSDAQAR